VVGLQAPRNGGNRRKPALIWRKSAIRREAIKLKPYLISAALMLTAGSALAQAELNTYAEGRRRRWDGLRVRL
jgi:hypothetical protein